MNKKLKQALGISLTVCAMTLGGCASIALYEDFNPTDQKTQKKVLSQDAMIAIGQSVNNDKKHGMVFIGQKYTYLITQGGEPFYALLKEFPANKLVLAADSPISLEFSNATQFKDTIIFNYADPIEKLTPQQVTRLKQLGFRDWKSEELADGTRVNYLRAIYDYQGELYQPTEATQIQHQFSKPYPLALTQKTEITTVNGKNIGKTIVLAPLALTFDVITAPIAGAFLLTCAMSRSPCFSLKI